MVTCVGGHLWVTCQNSSSTDYYSSPQALTASNFALSLHGFWKETGAHWAEAELFTCELPVWPGLNQNAETRQTSLLRDIVTAFSWKPGGGSEL